MVSAYSKAYKKAPIQTLSPVTLLKIVEQLSGTRNCGNKGSTKVRGVFNFCTYCGDSYRPLDTSEPRNDFHECEVCKRCPSHRAYVVTKRHATQKDNKTVGQWDAQYGSLIDCSLHCGPFYHPIKVGP